MDKLYRIEPKLKHTYKHGGIYLGDSIEYLRQLKDESVDLIVTSPPFGLTRPKEYGNVRTDQYLNWFKPYAVEANRVLKHSGSLVIDIGGTWNPKVPTRSLYHFKLLIMLCEEFGFKLAQEFYWWNPSRLPSPAEWVTVRRIRVKDSVNNIWWLSKSDFPKASNKRVLQEYSESMLDLLKFGYRANVRPSGHDISDQFSNNRGGSIPPNLLAIASTESNSSYIMYCKDRGIRVHPARFPSQLPEFFIRMLTNEGDMVVDPFAGSCVTGEVAERLNRRWVCCELDPHYVEGAIGRFYPQRTPSDVRVKKPLDVVYKIKKPNFAVSNNDPIDEKGGAGK
jgi:DNA modification methylase